MLLDTTRASLLLRVRNHDDASAWSEFDSLYRPMLRRFAAAFGLDPAGADEVAQDCMAQIAQHIQQFEYDPTKGRFKGWLRTVLNNAVRKRLRDRHEFEAETHHFDGAASPEPAPDDVFEDLWMTEHLRFCLKQLRREVEESSYQAFQMHVLEQHSVEEVCKQLSMTPNQLYKIKWRVTQRIGEKMKELLCEE